MAVIRVEKPDEVHLRVYSDDAGLEYDLSDYFTYEYPGAKFTPKYKARLWDGLVRLYCPIRKTLYVGLLDYLHVFAEHGGHTVEYIGDVREHKDISVETIWEFVKGLNLYGRGKPIDIRDYQVEAIHIALSHLRKVILSPTGSGKSLIIYSLIRWLLGEHKKILILVPTTSLVEQLYGDFEDYSTGNGWSTDTHCQKLYSGFPKHFQKDILISTWQSVYKQPKVWFDQFDAIIGDEAHLFKANSLTNIMSKLENVKHRIGTTGSLDDKKLHKLVLEGIFGPVHRVTTTKKLIEENKLSDLRIEALILKYPEEVLKSCKGMDYQKEMDFIVSYDKRNVFIARLVNQLKGNSLVLFQYVEKHGKPLYDLIKANTDRPVFFISGAVDTDERERIRHTLSTVDNAIVVASFGTTSTGINIPSIENIIFASPSKSKIRNLQSIGRGLRLNDGKTHCKLFDLADDLRRGSKANHTLRHAMERYKLYSEEQFKLKLTEIKL